MAGQRIRDPLHDLIEFQATELERTLWKVVRTRPFQRLRRVKQLGFSDLVYPGACHSRLAHSLGVFHTARLLLDIIQRNVDVPSTTKASRALAAALLHDVGHGPFSHAFESVGKRLDLKMAHHEQVSDALIRDSEISRVLNDELGAGFASDVADIIGERGASNIYRAVVSSQFDADRLDYMRRDRLMTGTQHSAIDFPWLLSNLEVGEVSYGVDEQAVGKVQTFVLGPKAIYAAEGYVLGLFQLYPTVYFHKATRGAEKLYTELLARLIQLVKDGSEAQTGLPSSHPLVKFAKAPDDVESALALDDTVVWGALGMLAECADPCLAQFAIRLRDRKLFKCCDVRIQLAKEKGDEACASAAADAVCTLIRESLLAWNNANSKNGVPRILIDEEKRSPYKRVEPTKGPLNQINIRTDGNQLVDLAKQSKVVAELQTFKLLRAYFADDDGEARAYVQQAIQEGLDKWPH